MMRMLLMYAVGIFVLFFLATQPAASAALIRDGWHAIGAFAHSMSVLVKNLSGTSHG